jgi:hypothetical protein
MWVFHGDVKLQDAFFWVVTIETAWNSETSVSCRETHSFKTQKNST